MSNQAEISSVRESRPTRQSVSEPVQRFEKVAKLVKKLRKTEGTGKLVAFVNQKGGVGKTTSALNLAAVLASSGAVVAFLDMDGKCDSTKSLSGGGSFPRHMGHVLLGEANPDEIMYPVSAGQFYDGQLGGKIDLYPSSVNLDLKVNELIRQDEFDVDRRLEEALEPLKWQYDVLLADLKPDIYGLLNKNTVMAADYYLTITTPRYFDAESLVIVEDRMRRTARYNKKLQRLGVLVNMWHNRKVLDEQMVAQLVADYGDAVFQNRIPDSTHISAAQVVNRSVVTDTEAGRVALAAFVGLAEELLERLATGGGKSNNGQ